MAVLISKTTTKKSFKLVSSRKVRNDRHCFMSKKFTYAHFSIKKTCCSIISKSSGHEEYSSPQECFILHK